MCISIHSKAQINNIDHFFASSPNAERLFNLFKTKFGLPVDWDYKTYGDFSSGAVTLGNTTFEFVSFKDIRETKFQGIALLPRQSVENFTGLLDEAKVIHDTIESNTYVMQNGNIAGWSNMGLKNILPDGISLFVYDYKNREELIKAIKKSTDSLKLRNGGPLGVVSLKEIVVLSSDFPLHKSELLKLPGVILKNDNLFGFKEGASIRLQKSGTNGIEKIIIKVNSLAKAKNYLDSQNLLGSSTKASVFIKPKATEGLIIELTDQ